MGLHMFDVTFNIVFVWTRCSTSLQFPDFHFRKIRIDRYPSSFPMHATHRLNSPQPVKVSTKTLVVPPAPVVHSSTMPIVSIIVSISGRKLLVVMIRQAVSTFLFIANVFSQFKSIAVKQNNFTY